MEQKQLPGPSPLRQSATAKDIRDEDERKKVEEKEVQTSIAKVQTIDISNWVPRMQPEKAPSSLPASTVRQGDCEEIYSYTRDTEDEQYNAATKDMPIIPRDVGSRSRRSSMEEMRTEQQTPSAIHKKLCPSCNIL